MFPDPATHAAVMSASDPDDCKRIAAGVKKTHDLP